MKRLLASCFGLGRLPIAPGTYGSVPSAMVFALLGYLGASATVISIAMAALALAGSVVCVKFASASIIATGKKDPREVVADEFAGQSVTFLLIPFLAQSIISSGGIWITALLGFFLFRLFDIAKPWPIRRLEKLPEGWGVLADDLLAGVYAGIALLLCIKTGVITKICDCLVCRDGALNIFSATILGAVQGLTEFLPVSSSGHLVLFEKIFGLKSDSPQMLLFDLAVHLGTVASILIVFYKSIMVFLKNLINFRKYGSTPTEIYRRNPSFRVMIMAIIATFVTGVLGIIFKDRFEAAFGNLRTIAFMWIITGTFLIITDLRKKSRMGLRQFGIIAAVVIGLAQAVAIMPGISRSGATICAGILVGLHRRWAVEFSFLLAIPAIMGAAAVESIKNFSVLSSGDLSIGMVLAGSITAALTGIIALKILMKTARKAELKLFAFYCYVLAGFVLLYL